MKWRRGRSRGVCDENASVGRCWLAIGCLGCVDGDRGDGGGVGGVTLVII